MEEDILNYLYQLSCVVGHPVLAGKFSSCLMSRNKSFPFKVDKITSIFNHNLRQIDKKGSKVLIGHT